MKKTLIILFVILSVKNINSQFLKCLNATSSVVVTSSSTYTPFNNECMFDNSGSQYTLVNQYIPTALTPTLFFRVNFIFIIDSVIPCPVTSTPINSLQTAALSTINDLNNYYSGLANTTPHLPVLNNTGTLTDTKIRFQLNNVYKIQHANAPSLINPVNIYPFTNDKAVNVYFMYLNPSNIALIGTGSAGLADGFINMYNTYAAPSFTGGNFYSDLLSHEFGHALGALSDHYTTNTVVPIAVPSATYPGNANSPGSGSAYIPDDAPLDILQSYNCYNTSDPTYPYRNNNLMGNSFCRNHLSAKQAAAFHYLVAKGITKKYTQFTNVAYPWIPSVLGSTPITLTGSQTFTGSISISTLTIPSGANISVSNATIAVEDYGKIIIEPGAKLTLNNVVIYEKYREWEGIEVRSMPYQLQPPEPITSTMTPFPGTGILFMNNSCIVNARIGLLIGKRNYIASNVQTYEGGGVVKLDYCTFVNNRTHILFDGYFPISNNTIMNASSIKNSVFLTNEGAMVSNTRFPTRNMVKLFDSKKVYFTACNWEYYNRDEYAWNDTIFGIYGYKTAVNLTKMGASASRFWPLLDYGVFLLDPSLPSNIEDCEFRCPNGIYINESHLDKIVRNTFRFSSFINNPYDAFGIYMQNCNKYKIENNLFFPNLIANKVGKVGIIINNSGPYPNKVYNNTFTNLEQGIWCQNQNYDPSSPTNDGLVLNCNDFSNVDFNIGVQKDFIPANNTGIAKDQGDISTPALGTRNTYNTPSCFNENKYYSFTPFELPPQISHPNYQGTQFRVSPQPTCSDNYEILDIPTVLPPATKSTYCANTSTLPASKSVHIAEVTNISSSLNNLISEYNQNLDDGNTIELLNFVNSNASAGQVKNRLINAPFLSDTVMQAYFSKSNTPPGHAKQVHEKNAPVSPSVWESIVSRNYPNGIFNQMQAVQNTPNLSPRNKQMAQQSILKNELNYANMHYAQAVIADSSLTYNTKDTLKSIIINSNTANTNLQIIELEFDSHNYLTAIELLQQYKQNASTQYELDYADFMIEYARVLNSNEGVYGVLNQVETINYFNTVALNYLHPCTIKAQNILNLLTDRAINIQILKPIFEGNNRLVNQLQVDEDSNLKTPFEMVKIYPNPASKQFTISNPTNEILSLAIYNTNGQLMQKLNINSTQINIACQLWPSGIYFVNLINQTGQIKTQKLIIE